jgi:hypothetical protein
VATFLERKTIMRRIMFTLLLMLAPLTGYAAAATDPVVQSGTVNYATKQVTLTGTGFKPEKAAPVVELEGAKLKVDSASNTKIVVTLPAAMAVGTFSLVVGNSEGKSTSFDLAYGASGPQGTQGLEGPQGPAGPQGPVGPAAAAKTFVVANQPVDVNMPVEGQAYAVNSIVLPNAGTYIIQGQETLSTEFTAVECSLAASPVALRSLPPKGLTQSFLPYSDNEVQGTMPIFGYYSTTAAGMTVTLWCTSYGGEGYVWAFATGGSYNSNQSASVLTALQVQ